LAHLLLLSAVLHGISELMYANPTSQQYQTHLPMVVSALGEVDGYVKLLQLVHDLIGTSATELLKKFSKEKDMDNL
jgi:hypothetical protein